MKNINILLILSFCLFSLWACDDEGDHIKLNDNNLVAPVLKQTIPQDFVLTENTDMNTVIGSWEWDKAEYGVQTPPVYVLEVDTLDTFATLQKYTSQSGTSVEITNGVINKAAMMFVNKSQPITLYFRVKASIGNAEAGPILYSEKTAVSFTCVYIPNIKPVLYIIGAGLVGWNNDASAIGADLQLFFADDSEGTNRMYTYTGFFKGGQGLKFPAKAGDWTYGVSGASIVEGGADFIVSGADGLYTLEADLKAMTIKMTAYIGTATAYTSVGIVGDAAGGWPSDDNATDIIMTQVVPHVWVSPSVTLKAGELKFRANKKWDTSWGAKTKTDQLPYGQTGGENIIIDTAGDYYIAMSDITGHYLIIKKTELP